MAVTSETLERANVHTFDELANVVPDVTISKTTRPANNSINIRGIGTYAYSIATQPATVVIVDDISKLTDYRISTLTTTLTRTSPPSPRRQHTVTHRAEHGLASRIIGHFRRK